MCVYKRENNRERLKLLEVWNFLHMEEDTLSFACSLLLFSLFMSCYFLSSFFTFYSQKWGDKVARCCSSIRAGQ